MKFPKKGYEKDHPETNDRQQQEAICEEISSPVYPQYVDLNTTHASTVPGESFATQLQTLSSKMQEEPLDHNLEIRSQELQKIQSYEGLSAYQRGDFDDDIDPDQYLQNPSYNDCDTWSNPDRFFSQFEAELPITQDERVESMLLEAIADTETKGHTEETEDHNGRMQHDPNYILEMWLAHNQEQSKRPDIISKANCFQLDDRFLDFDAFHLQQDLHNCHLAHARNEMEGFGIAEQAMARGKYELSEQVGVLGSSSQGLASFKSCGPSKNRNTPKEINRHILADMETEAVRKKSKTTSDEIFSQTDEYTTSVPSHLLAARPICNCKNSKCVKLYCACFRKGIGCCVECKCIDCHNNITIISKDDLKRKQRNAMSRAEAEESCCNCRMSFCEKSYCACARNNKRCGPNCRCFNCKNPNGAKGSHSPHR
jgi:Tesmin/TSO1-like CXC domain, cysteine-rich domain